MYENNIAQQHVPIVSNNSNNVDLNMSSDLLVGQLINRKLICNNS